MPLFVCLLVYGASAEDACKRVLANPPHGWDVHEVRGVRDADEGSEAVAMALSTAENGGGDEKAIVDAVAKMGKGCRVEVGATAPCVLPLGAGGGNAAAVTCDTWDDEKARDVLRRHGVVVCTAPVYADGEGDLQALRALADRHVRAADAALVRLGRGGGTTTLAFSELGSRGDHRFDLIIASGLRREGMFELFPPSTSSSDATAVAALAREAPWVPLIRAALGDDWSCQVSLVYSRPGAPDQRWHSDGAHVQASAPPFFSASGELLTGSGGEGEAEPYSVCVFVALSACGPSTPGVGATSFWPGSHSREGLVGFGAFADALSLSVEADLRHPGAFVVYDYRLLHRGLAYSLNDGPDRTLIQLVYHKAWYRERRNYGDAKLFG